MLKIAWKACSDSSVAAVAFDYYVIGVNGGVVAFDDSGVVVALTDWYCAESQVSSRTPIHISYTTDNNFVVVVVVDDVAMFFDGSPSSSPLATSHLSGTAVVVIVLGNNDENNDDDDGNGGDAVPASSPRSKSNSWDSREQQGGEKSSTDVAQDTSQTMPSSDLNHSFENIEPLILTRRPLFLIEVWRVQSDKDDLEPPVRPLWHLNREFRIPNTARSSRLHLESHLLRCFVHHSFLEFIFLTLFSTFDRMAWSECFASYLWTLCVWYYYSRRSFFLHYFLQDSPFCPITYRSLTTI